jgi:hypothetical protein
MNELFNLPQARLEDLIACGEKRRAILLEFHARR